MAVLPAPITAMRLIFLTGVSAPLGELVAAHQIHAGQELVGAVDAVEVLAGDAQEPGQAGAGADEDGVEALADRVQRLGLAHRVVHDELHAHVLQAVDLARRRISLGRRNWGMP